jgi:hypothetical protein
MSYGRILNGKSCIRAPILGTQSLSLLLPARGEKVGMRGRRRESEPAETPPHRAEFRFSSLLLGPLPARGARSAARAEGPQ